MNFLLDTHALLWAIGAPKRISPRVKELILDPSTELAASTVNIWEITIKTQQGNLEIPVGPEYFDFQFSRLGIRRVLNVNPNHIYALLKLPRTHKDPFDRMLAAQCIVEKMTLVTSDRIFRKYPIETIW